MKEHIESGQIMDAEAKLSPKRNWTILLKVYDEWLKKTRISSKMV
jgi:hypothetical protein